MTADAAQETAPSFYAVDDAHSGEHGREVLCFGPPGTGKTRFLTGSIKHTAYVRGPDRLMVASFTRTAAHELAGRLGATKIPRGQVGTLHSIAFAALDRPELTQSQLPEWNKAHPALAVSVKPGGATNMDEAGPAEMAAGGATEGDVLMAGYDSCRNQQLDRAAWPRDVADFAARWEDWKQSEGLVDFTDLIEMARDDCAVCPGSPEVGFVDEAQDMTRLEMSLIRSWGQHMERLILAGDDDQLIFRFRGATPDAMLDGRVADADRLVLRQSYRIPSTVQGAAEAWIRQVSRRQEKLYAPRPEAGLVRHISAGYAEPMALLRHVETALGQEFPDRETGEMRPASVMVIAPCGYQLDPLKHELRKRGLPFSNPWRPTRGDWNPMRSSTGTTVAAKDRLLAYMALEQRDWTGEDLRRWLHVVKTTTAGMVRGAKGQVAALPADAIPYEQVAALWDDPAQLERAVEPSLDWLAANLAAASRAGMEFPIKVARAYGTEALTDAPRLFIGTAHSFKGAEADVVFVVPDISQRGNAEWQQRGESRDSVIRQFYVAMTRARHELVVCAASTGMHVSPEKLVAGARPAA